MVRARVLSSAKRISFLQPVMEGFRERREERRGERMDLVEDKEGWREEQEVEEKELPGLREGLVYKIIREQGRPC